MSVFSFEPLGEADLPFLLEVRNDCRHLLHDDRAFTLRECQDWFRSARPEFWVIRHESARIGYFRLSNRDAVDCSIYVGADLHPRYRGRGLAKGAYRDFFRLLKRRENLSFVKLEVLSHNLRAYALYLRLGFIEVRRKKNVTIRDGTQVDSIVMKKTL